jgi:hypothetical protein
LCRIFKKTIQIPAKSKEQVEETKKEMMLEEQLQGEDSSSTENSSEIMETMNIKVLNQDENPKFPCDASSSDVTQGTCTPTNTCNNITDDFHAQFACDEANSSAISYAIGIGYSSNLFQVTFFKSLIYIT